MTGGEQAGRETAQSPSGVPPLDIPRLSKETLQPDAIAIVAPQPLRADGGLQLGEVLHRSVSPLQRSRSPGVLSNTSHTFLDSESRMEAAGLLMEELSTLKGIASSMMP